MSIILIEVKLQLFYYIIGNSLWCVITYLLHIIVAWARLGLQNSNAQYFSYWMEKHNLNFDILDTSPISKPGNMGYFIWRKRKKRKRKGCLKFGLYKRFHLTNNVSIQCTISSEFFKPLWLYSSIILLYTLCWMISWWMGGGEEWDECQ